MTETYAERRSRLELRTSVDGWKGPMSRRVDSWLWKQVDLIVAGVGVEPWLSCGSDGTVILRWRAELDRMLDVETDGGHVEFEDDDEDWCMPFSVVAVVNTVRDFLDEALAVHRVC